MPNGLRDAGALRVARVPTIVVVLAVAAVVFTLLSLRPLTHSEARYVEAGAEMAASGDWIVPHLSYVPYFEKPILTYWVEALSQLLFGSGMLAVRLPSILAGLTMVAVTYEIGRSVRSAAFGLGAAAILVSAVMFLALGSAMTTDPLFSALLAVAWYAYWRHDRAPASSWIWTFWGALGFAVLTKGPLGVALVGSTVGAYLLLSGRMRDFLAMRPVRGTLVILAVNLPWSAAVWMRDPRFLEFFYVRENLRALVDSSINHAGPPWYYVPVLIGAFFPFSLLAAWALGAECYATLVAAGRKRLSRPADAVADVAPGRLYVVCMLVPPLLLLSVSASKLATYAMPLFPATALVVAWYLADRFEHPTGAMRWTTLVQAVLLAAGAGTALLLSHRLPENVLDLLDRTGPTLGVAGGLILAGMLGGSVALAKGRVVAGMIAVALGTIGGALVLGASMLEIGGERDAGILMQEVVRLRKPGERIIVAGTVADDYSIVLATGERPYIWGLARELGMGHFTEVTSPDRPIPDEPYDMNKKTLPANPWLLDLDGLRAMWTGADRVWFVGRPKDVDKLRAERLRVEVLADTDVRSIATNRPLTESK